jgi:predicted enzyme related to lactoylglutathione lyase
MFMGAGATLPVSDLARAKAFYRDVLGLEPFQEEPGGSARYRVGDTMFMLYPSEFAGTNRATAMGLQVEDIDAAVAELRSRGAEFQDLDLGDVRTVDGVVTLPGGGRGGWFTDTEGNVIGVFQDT